MAPLAQAPVPAEPRPLPHPTTALPQPPFAVGGVVPPDLLALRGALISELSGWMAEGFRVLLTGPRRCGKSSIVLAVAARLRAETVLTVYVDLAAAPTLRDAAADLLAQCRALSGGLGLPDPPPAATPEAAFLAALEAPERLAVAARGSAALLLDGCDHLARLGGLDALLSARPTLLRQQRTGYLLAGAYDAALQSLAGTRRSPFALPIGLLPPPAEAWRAPLSTRLEAAGVAAADAAAQRLVWRTGGHPYDLMAACAALVAARPRSRTAGRAAADAAIATVYPLLQATFAAELAALGPTPHGFLHRLATGRHLYREAGPPASIKRAVDTLVAGGMLRRGLRGVYTFTEPLLAESLAGAPQQ